MCLACITPLLARHLCVLLPAVQILGLKVYSEQISTEKPK